MTKLSPGQEYLTPFHRCAEREGGDQRRSELGLVMHIQNGARSANTVARALPFVPSSSSSLSRPSKSKILLFFLLSIRSSARACPCVSRRRINPRLPLRFNSIVERDNRSSRWRNDSRGSIDRFRAWKKRGRETMTFESEWWNSRAIRMWKFNSEKAVKRCYYYA